MPSFVYRAADANGRVHDGLLEAASEADLTRLLQRQSLTPLRMKLAKSKRVAAKEGSRTTTKIRLRLRELLEFTRQFKVMLASGVSLLSTLAVLRQRATGGYRTLLDQIAADIQRGATLSEAMAAHPRTFDPFYIGTIRAGEAGGIHTDALDGLVAHYERRANVRRELIGALTYPAIVVFALIVACIVMLTWVVPQFQRVFLSSGSALPLPTRVLLALSDFLTTHPWELGVALTAAGLAAWALSRVQRVRQTLGQIASRLPIIGHVYHLSSVMQFSRMIALLERAGLPLLETLKVVEDMLMPGPIKVLAGEIRRNVAMGSSITEAATAQQVLPELVEQMMAVGEQTGRLDETLAAAATHYEEETRVKIRQLTAALEPLLTLVVAALVMFVALSTFLPMWDSNSLLLRH